MLSDVTMITPEGRKEIPYPFRNDSECIPLALKECGHKAYVKDLLITQKTFRNFPCGSVVKNWPSNAGSAGSIPGQRTKIPHGHGATKPTHHN